MSNAQLTPAQSDALSQITGLMREHFDSAIFVFEVDAAKDNDPTLCNLGYRVCGLFSSSLGLLEYARHKVLTERDEE